MAKVRHTQKVLKILASERYPFLLTRPIVQVYTSRAGVCGSHATLRLVPHLLIVPRTNRRRTVARTGLRAFHRK